MVEGYEEYFTPKGQIKRSIPAELKNEIRNAILAPRNLWIAGGDGNINSVHSFECVCGHTWESTLTNVYNQGTGCSKCSGKYKYSEEEYLQKCAEAEPRYSLHNIIDFKNGDSYLTYTCDLGHRCTSTSIRKFLSGRRCPKCNGQHSDVFYVWRIKDTNIYKVGISSKTTVGNRIQDVSTAHRVESELVLRLETDQARALEKVVINSFPSAGDLVSKAQGYTEMVIIEEITEVFKIVGDTLHAL